MSLTEVDATTITLATGERITIIISSEEGCAPAGHSIKLICDRGRMIVSPRADNCVTITTHRSFIAEDAATEAAVAERNAKRANPSWEMLRAAKLKGE